MPTFVRRKEILNILKVHYQTLYRMEKEWLIDVKRTNGWHRLYNLNKYLRNNNLKEKKGFKENDRNGNWMRYRRSSNNL